MKKLLFFCSLLLALVAKAQSTLSLSIPNFEIDAGETKAVNIAMQNEGYDIISFEFKMKLPEGLTIVGDDDEPYILAERKGGDNRRYVDWDYNEKGYYTLLSYSSKNKAFAGTSGDLVCVTLKADENISAGSKEIKVFDIELSTADAPYYPADASCTVNVFRNCIVSITCDETKGSVNGQGTYRSSSEATVTATPAEGYHFVNWTIGDTQVSTESSYTFTVSENIELVANFAPNQYTMTFVLDNGEENVVKTQDYGTELAAPEDPTKTGFTFNGWEPEVPSTIPASDQTYTAQWERNKYKLTFVVDGVESTTEVLYEAEITKPEDPAKEGYTFTGWNPEVPETMPAEDVTCTAQFTVNQYTMTFVLDNGEENVVKTQDYGTELAAPEDPTKTGFTFNGWEPEVPATIPASDQTFTAQWERNKYKLTFVVDGVETITEVLYEAEITKPEDPTKEGYTFTGWNPEVPETMPAEDVTCTAQFTVNQYTMTFVLDNGEENVVKTQDYGTELAAPEDPTKTGFTFKGWEPEVPATIPASDQTFTAQWERNKYRLTFVVDGEETTTEVLYEAEITKPEDPTKEGYTFTGWNPEVPETMPAEDVTCTAQFTVNQYTMTFVLDNGEENVVKTQDYGTELAAPEDPTKTGFTFKGWEPEVPATIPASDQTFTAQWERNKYKLTFVVDGVETITEVLYEAEITKPEDPTKEGHTFTGWNPEVPETMPAEDVTCTAQFTVNQYTMTFVLDNGEENVVKTQDYGTELAAPEDPTKTGFTFNGWEPEVPATIPASDQTFTAQWERNKYRLTFVVDGEETTTEVLYEAEITKPEDPTKEGYTFTGWNPEVPETMPAEDVTCTAQFTVNQYTMTFVLDNGEENVVKTQDYGTELVAPEDPTKTGFTFKGWSPEVPATIPASDQTFTAQWERNKYRLTFVVDGEETTTEVLYEAEITKPEDPTKEGYTFTGWNPEVPETMPAEDVTCTAQFTVNQYTMTFVLDNGEENVVKTQDYGTELAAPEDPTKTGFTFKGWEPEVPATIPASDQTFTAQWERNKYKLTFVVDGEETTTEVLYEEEITKPEDPTKEGYTFTGWNPEVPETMPAEDVTCTAQFEVNIYAVIYIVNGNEWQRDSIAYGEPIVLRDYTPEEGYVFNGWTSDAIYETMPAHDVIYTAGITTGILTLRTDKSVVDVYTLNGTLVVRRMLIGDLRKRLPRGVYIIDGTKLIIQ